MSLSVSFQPLPTLYACRSVPIVWSYVSGNTSQYPGEGLKLVFVSAEASVSTCCWRRGPFAYRSRVGSFFGREYKQQNSCCSDVFTRLVVDSSLISTSDIKHRFFLPDNSSGSCNRSNNNTNPRPSGTKHNTAHENRRESPVELHLLRLGTDRPPIRDV